MNSKIVKGRREVILIEMVEKQETWQNWGERNL